MQSDFPTTHWSLVLAARDRDTAISRDAMETLCKAYWQPLYSFVRRKGHKPEESRDLTQACFAQLLQRDFLRDLDPDSGRFRSFLLASMKNFLTDEKRKEMALKRGAGRTPIPLDLDTAERGFRREPAEQRTPETLFEKHWAVTVVNRSLERLRCEAESEGKTTQFTQLKVFLTGESPVLPYREVAADLGMTEDAVKMAVHRLRKRYGKALRAEIAETVAGTEAVDDEVRHLLDVLRG